MTVEWFSFFFGAMVLLCVEFVALVVAGVVLYNKQQKKGNAALSSAKK